MTEEQKTAMRKAAVQMRAAASELQLGIGVLAQADCDLDMASKMAAHRQQLTALAGDYERLAG